MTERNACSKNIFTFPGYQLPRIALNLFFSNETILPFFLDTLICCSECYKHICSLHISNAKLRTTLSYLIFHVKFLK